MPGVLFRLGARQHTFEVFRFCSWGAAYTDPHHFARSLVPKSQSHISNLANWVTIDADDDRAFFQSGLRRVRGVKARAGASPTHHGGHLWPPAKRGDTRASFRRTVTKPDDCRPGLKDQQPFFSRTRIRRQQKKSRVYRSGSHPMLGGVYSRNLQRGQVRSRMLSAVWQGEAVDRFWRGRILSEHASLPRSVPG
jgi:hypothetical protein